MENPSFLLNSTLNILGFFFLWVKFAANPRHYWARATFTPPELSLKYKYKENGAKNRPKTTPLTHPPEGGLSALREAGDGQRAAP